MPNSIHNVSETVKEQGNIRDFEIWETAEISCAPHPTRHASRTEPDLRPAFASTSLGHWPPRVPEKQASRVTICQIGLEEESRKIQMRLLLDLVLI